MIVEECADGGSGNDTEAGQACALSRDHDSSGTVKKERQDHKSRNVLQDTQQLNGSDIGSMGILSSDIGVHGQRQPFS